MNDAYVVDKNLGCKLEIQDGDLPKRNADGETVIDLSDEQKYLIAQIRDLQNKASQAKFQLDQFQVGLNFFTEKLITSINSKEDSKEE